MDRNVQKYINIFKKKTKQRMNFMNKLKLKLGVISGLRKGAHAPSGILEKMQQIVLHTLKISIDEVVRITTCNIV